MILRLFFFVFFFQVICCDWICKNVESLLEIESLNLGLLNTNIQVEYQYTNCRKCNLMYLTTLILDPKNNSKLIGKGIFDPNFSYQIQVVEKNQLNQTTKIICPSFKYNSFGECGVYKLSLDNNPSCSIINTVKPNNVYIVLYYGIPLIIAIIIVICLFEKYYDKLISIVLSSKRVNSVEEINLDSSKPKKLSERHDSIDTFRGFSLVLMIFVMYGWGTFMYHSPWSGLNLAAFVFPWFLFIMGTSVPIAIDSIKKKSNTTQTKIFLRIFTRTLKMFFIGFILVSDYNFVPSKARIFGVLQRISICYFVVATLELFFWKPVDTLLARYSNTWKKHFGDFLCSLPQFLIIHAIIFIWFMIAYLLPVPGCPTGYFGPGGSEYGGQYYNCTGGATGYIDRVILGYDHLYTDVSITNKVYQIKVFEPEGILSTLPSICLAYYGVVAGRIFIYYKSPIKRIIYWTIWGLITFILFGVLCQFDLIDGWLPVNKNMWTYTYTLVTASSSFFILALFYIVVEFKKLWSGAPFRHVGLNSIFIYICQSVFWFR